MYILIYLHMRFRVLAPTRRETGFRVSGIGFRHIPAGPVDGYVSASIYKTVCAVQGAPRKNLTKRENAVEHWAIILAHEAHVVLLHAVRHLVHIVWRDAKQKVDVLFAVELLHLLPRVRARQPTGRKRERG